MKVTPTKNEQLTPDWGAIERDVILKLRYLRLAWEHTASAPSVPT